MVFYFTASGNCLHVAKNLNTDLRSIPQEMKKNERHYKADKIGIICPIFELDLPDYVKDFIRTSTRVCPRGCIRLEDGRPVYDYTDCINCTACAHACPKIAIKLTCVKEPNPNARYRNPNITLAELIQANRQN